MGGSLARASFRIFGDGVCFCPDKADANPHDRYEIIGSLAPTERKNWTVGEHERDDAQPGSRFEIRLFLDENKKPVWVDWPPVNKVAGMAKLEARGFLAVGP